MDMINYLYDFKGCKVVISTSDGDYEGDLLNVNSELLKVSLARVVTLPERKQHLGIQHFFSREIQKYVVVPNPLMEKRRRDASASKMANTLVKNHSHQNPSLGDLMADFFDDDDDLMSITDGDLDDSDIRKTKEEYVLQLPEHLSDMLPLDHILIDEMEDDFHKAIRHIKQQEEIGVSFEGENICRSGNLCFVAISTSCCTFLFDISFLKKDAFEKGLKEIFESTEILKIVHDCRQPSDALCHQYNVRLAHVFDTQVGDVFADMQNNKPGRVAKYVHPLHHCLIKYLQLTAKQACFRTIKGSDNQPMSTRWNTRPITDSLLDEAIKNAIYLKLLKAAEEKVMMRSFCVATDVFLNVLRNSSNKELELEPSSPHLLPEALLHSGLQTFHMKEFSEVSPSQLLNTVPRFLLPNQRSQQNGRVSGTSKVVRDGDNGAGQIKKDLFKRAQEIAKSDVSLFASICQQMGLFPSNIPNHKVDVQGRKVDDQGCIEDTMKTLALVKRLSKKSGVPPSAKASSSTDCLPQLEDARECFGQPPEQLDCYETKTFGIDSSKVSLSGGRSVGKTTISPFEQDRTESSTSQRGHNEVFDKDLTSSKEESKSDESTADDSSAIESKLFHPLMFKRSRGFAFQKVPSAKDSSTIEEKTLKSEQLKAEKASCKVSNSYHRLSSCSSIEDVRRSTAVEYDCCSSDSSSSSPRSPSSSSSFQWPKIECDNKIDPSRLIPAGMIY